MVAVIEHHRIAKAKRAFTTRRVPVKDLQVLLDQEDLAGYSFRPGDLALARIDRIGHHTRIERPDGRKARLFVGDEIIVVLASRYAPDQYEAMSPTALGPCHLAAAGGIAGRITEIHDRIIRPTEISILGLIGKPGQQPLNIADYALSRRSQDLTIPTIGIVGTAMNAGKTTCAAGLIHGLTRAGYNVGAIKMTGTGAGGDYWFYKDSGAALCLDFTDAGYASTYREEPSSIEAAGRNLLREAQNAGCDIAIVEISDGLAQPETEALLNRASIQALLPNMFFAARESAGAGFGVAWLRSRGFNIAGVSGAITRSPLAMRELSNLTNLASFTFEELCDPTVARRIAKLKQRNAQLGVLGLAS